MNAVIYKYPIKVGAVRETEITIPEYSECIKVGCDPSGLPCVWYMIRSTDYDNKQIATWTIIGTGQELPEGLLGRAIHRGSFNHSQFMWHAFENLDRKAKVD